MATSGEEVTTPIDDRWSAFQDPIKKSNNRTQQEEDKGPEFSEYVEKVLEQRWSQREQDKMIALATQLAQLLTGVAYNVTAEWKQYLRTDKRTGVKIGPLRVHSEGQIDCLVPLKRPQKPDSFKVERCTESVNSHQCQLLINPSLNHQEKLAVRTEWSSCLDKCGCMSSSAVLAWFNRGIEKACSILQAESRSMSHLVYHSNPDRTCTVYVILTTPPTTSTPANDATRSTNDITAENNDIAAENNDITAEPNDITAETNDIRAQTPDITRAGITNTQRFSINFHPVFGLDKLPSNTNLQAPLPNYGKYIPAHVRLKQRVEKNLEQGIVVAYLDPKDTHQLKGQTSTHWQIGMLISDFYLETLGGFSHDSQDFSYTDVLQLFYLVRKQCCDELGGLNNDMVMSALFSLSQRKFPELTTIKDWFLGLVKTLTTGLTNNFLHSFQSPRLNLLQHYHISDEERMAMLETLDEMVKAVGKDGRNIYSYTGYVEKKGVSRADSESSESSHDDDDDDG